MHRRRSARAVPGGSASMFGMNDASEFAFLVVLLPLLPAILIFLMFPKTEMVAQGPLQGLSIRAGGAFGAYLIVLLVLMTG